MNPLADRVRSERLARKWSVRRAASETGGVLSNTWWAKFEDGIQPLTDGIRQGVASAFGWPADWADTPTPSEDDPTRSELAEIRKRIEALEAQLIPGDRVVTASPEARGNARKPRPAHSE